MVSKDYVRCLKATFNKFRAENEAISFKVIKCTNKDRNGKK